MRILFLDDNKERHRVFRRNSIGCSVDFVWNAQEAIEKLQDKDIEYDLIMLDHDLDFETQNTLIDDEEDGRFVCKNITDCDHIKNSYVVIHSLNFEGGRQMVDILKEAGFENSVYMPFAWRWFHKTETGCEFIKGKENVGPDV